MGAVVGSVYISWALAVHSEICSLCSSSVLVQFVVYHQPELLAGSCCGLVLPDCCVLAEDTSLSPQEHCVTEVLFFPFSNLIFVPFRKPAWKDGSTATCVLAVDNILYIANLGDSRVSRMETTGGIFILPRALWRFCLFVWDV